MAVLKCVNLLLWYIVNNHSWVETFSSNFSKPGPCSVWQEVCKGKSLISAVNLLCSEHSSLVAGYSFYFLDNSSQFEHPHFYVCFYNRQFLILFTMLSKCRRGLLVARRMYVSPILLWDDGLNDNPHSFQEEAKIAYF